MSWLEAIRSALIALPKLIDLIQELLRRSDALREADLDKASQEIRNAQNELAREIQTVQDDEKRGDLARRLSEFERGIH
jgi:hypothetical protein